MRKIYDPMEFQPGMQQIDSDIFDRGKEALYLGALSENCTAHRELCHYWLRCAHAGSAVQSGIHSDLSGSGAAFWLAGG